MISSWGLIPVLIYIFYVNYYSKLQQTKAATASFISKWKTDKRKICDSLLSGGRLLIMVLVPWATSQTFAGNVIAKVSQGFGTGPAGWSTPPPPCLWKAITDWPQNLQESRIKCLFSVSLASFPSVHIVAGFFPKEITSCEPWFDFPIFPLPHFSFILGIIGLPYIRWRLRINAICLFMAIPYRSFRHGDSLTRQNHAFLSPPECSCLRWHVGNGSQPLLAGEHQPWKPPKLPHFHSLLKCEALESKMACKQG